MTPWQLRPRLVCNITWLLSEQLVLIKSCFAGDPEQVRKNPNLLVHERSLFTFAFCACVCLCAWVHVCLCVWVHVCFCVWVHVCLCACFAWAPASVYNYSDVEGDSPERPKQTLRGKKREKTVRRPQHRIYVVGVRRHFFLVGFFFFRSPHQCTERQKHGERQPSQPAASYSCTTLTDQAVIHEGKVCFPIVFIHSAIFHACLFWY